MKTLHTSRQCPDTVVRGRRTDSDWPWPTQTSVSQPAGVCLHPATRQLLRPGGPGRGSGPARGCPARHERGYGEEAAAGDGARSATVLDAEQGGKVRLAAAQVVLYPPAVVFPDLASSLPPHARSDRPRDTR